MVLQTIYELRLTTWAITAGNAGRHAAHEAALRMRYWTDGDTTPWTLL